MKVVLNIDDYCFSKSQIEGTIYAYQNGVASSTTCMANMPDELLEKIYIDKKVCTVPCLFVAIMLDAVNKAIKENGYVVTRTSNYNDEFLG